MLRVSESTPLLARAHDDRWPNRRSAWQLVLAGALSLALLSFVRQQHEPSIALKAATSFDASSGDADDVAFLTTSETFKDPSVDPCVDFYSYACGGWLQSHDLPSDRPTIDSSFYVVSESNKATIQQVIAADPPQIGQLFRSCLNGQEVDTGAVQFVARLIDNVHKADSTLALLELAGELDQSLGISSFFSLFVGADPQDPSTNVLQLAQGGLTLPSREYYLEQSKVDAFAELYVDYVAKLFAVGDLDKHNASEYAQAVLDTETAFAKISLPNAALRNPWTTNTAYPFAEIATRYPLLMAYLNGINKLEPFPMLHAIIATPDFFEAQNELLSDESLLPQLKNYLSFHLIDSFGSVLGEYFRRASHEFHGKIQGAGALLPRDQFCVHLTTSFLGDELGEYYMKDVFGPDAKAAAQALVAEIEESLKALLMTESWLDKITYDAAVDKLNKVKNYIGGPDEVPPLPFELQADTFFNNVKSLMQLSAAGTIQAIGQPVDEGAWDMFPSTVNAYYDPSANKMVFPAAILQPPFYSAEHFPAAANFARIGMVMGHELSHGFDDQGRNYDSNGALRSWWTPSVSAEFAEKAQCLAAQYSAFPVVSIEDGHVLGNVNGNLTLGENIADNGGIHLAYEAYQLWKSTISPSPATSPPQPPAEVPQQTPEPVETAPAPEPVATPPTLEPSQPSPNEDIPAITPAPVIPIPNEPAPQPSETGPGAEIPAATQPPPVLPVPEAVTPEPVQTEPNGEIPAASPSPPPVIPEPQPADIGPGEVIPDETSPAPAPPVPEEQTPTPTQPATETPLTTPPPTEPSQTPAQTEPATEPPVVTPAPSATEPKPVDRTLAPIPGVSTPPTPAVGTTMPIVPLPSPAATEVSPGVRKHNKGKEKSTKPEEKEHHEIQEHSSDDANKSGSEEDGSSSNDHHKHTPAKKENDQRSDNGKHIRDEHDSKDEEDKPSKRGHSDKHDKESEHEKQHDHGEHDKRKENDRSERHGKRSYNNDDDRDRHEPDNHESKEERREERKERKELKREEGEENHHGKGKHHHRFDEDHGDEEESEHHKNHHEKHNEKHHGKHRHREEEEREEEHGRHRHKHDKEWERESEHHDRHRHKHDEEWERESEHHGCEKHSHDCGSKRHKWTLAENKYPFSGGNMEIHTMVEKLARAIVQPSDPVADDRLFFTAFAQNWCEKHTPGYAELLRTIDPHSPGKWRVNGPLMNFDKFSEAFSCPVGTPMNPKKKCVIW
ncbi:unnamed protein product [Phytophthora fragariaefolia]|uniref:Unnamed protein product n=1 Tax=Phytophthora fragariaefolia TaxID=1490495 RepID=A0A9W7CX85_9STRA|nr:unnamed protein product [Phytophthora fragariaefolia]